MNANRVNWVSKGATIFATLFFVFCVLSIVESKSSIHISKLGIESIAPENLKRVPESFEGTEVTEGSNPNLKLND